MEIQTALEAVDEELQVPVQYQASIKKCSTDKMEQMHFDTADCTEMTVVAYPVTLMSGQVELGHIVCQANGSESWSASELLAARVTNDGVSAAPEDPAFPSGDSLIQSGESDSGTWNYDAIYENVKSEIQAADIAMVDQETVLTTEHDAVSGYPSFATPTEVGDALINAGFDVIESATNHIDDYGYDYMAQTLNFWKTSYPDVPVLGIHDSEEDANTVKTLEVNGIKVAFLDYTYGTNNSGAGDGRDYMIDISKKTKLHP